MTSTIVTYLHRHKSRQATVQSSGTAAATGERKSGDNASEAAEGYRRPNRDEADDLAPARGIAVSVLVGIAMWLVIVALLLLITWFFWGPA
jgi:Flp pilus assembly protein TadB